MAGNIRKGG